MDVNNIIIWGHKLHSHTHSYIHNAFFIAFKKLGYDTYWFDDNDDTSNFDFSNSLFITEHQVDNKIPKRKDCLYFVHFVDPGHHHPTHMQQTHTQAHIHTRAHAYTHHHYYHRHAG